MQRAGSRSRPCFAVYSRPAIPITPRGCAPQLVIVYGPPDQPYLEAYTITEIEKLEAKIERLPNSPLKRKLVRDITSRSHHTEVDPDGRLVLPLRHRDKIGLEKEAFFVGTSGHLPDLEPRDL